MRYASGLYVILCVSVQLAIFNIQFFLDNFFGAPHISIMFAAALMLSLLGMTWKNLRRSEIFAVPAILLVLELIELKAMMIFQSGGIISREVAAMGLFDLFFYTLIPQSAGIQFFAALILSAGRWMKTNFETYSLRKAAADDEELEKIFDMKMRLLPEEKLTYSRYKKLLLRSFTLLGMVRNAPESMLSSIRTDDTLFLYDLAVDNRLELLTKGEELIHFMLRRPEIATAGLKRIVALISSKDDPSREIYRNLNFNERKAETAEKPSDLYPSLGLILEGFFEDWQPFRDVKYFYEYNLNSK